MVDAEETTDGPGVAAGAADAPGWPASLAATVATVLDRPAAALRLLDAARGCVLDRGVSRLTMSDVARRADVSRTTLYRHYPDVEAVLRDLMTHDFGGIALRCAEEAASLPSARERIVRTAIGCGRGLRADPLFRKVLDVDPEALLPYVTARPGVSQQMMLDLAEVAIREGQDEGSVRAGDPALLARLLVLQVQALTVSAGVVTADDPRVEADLLDAAAVALDAQLRPTGS
ncbi:MAG: TetR/AcrR family transcriptional regulator [Solirubrobacteraceae bacterium]|nr:TetR/AcrR family transcriptional regulator [Solirubrobacteraceae bacterium]